MKELKYERSLTTGIEVSIESQTKRAGQKNVTFYYPMLRITALDFERSLTVGFVHKHEAEQAAADWVRELFGEYI